MRRQRELSKPRGPTRDPALEEAARRFAERARQRGQRPAEVLPHEPGQPKLSQALLRIAEPFLGDGGLPRARTVVPLAAIAWNLAVARDLGVKNVAIDGLLRKAGSGTPAFETACRHVVEEMIERKRKLYPDLRNFVTDWELTPDGEGGYHVTVSYDVRTERAPRRPY